MDIFRNKTEHDIFFCYLECIRRKKIKKLKKKYMTCPENHEELNNKMSELLHKEQWINNKLNKYIKQIQENKHFDKYEVLLFHNWLKSKEGQFELYLIMNEK